MKKLISVFQLLSDETRLRIILLLAQDELCVCELSKNLGVSQPTISKNLTKLKDLDLVISVRREKFISYRLKTENYILAHTLDDILQNIEVYPQLVLDQKQLVDNRESLIQCCSKNKENVNKGIKND